ncbi:hypothetical protein GC176_14375 [bacterium]|nr:hypothetical protein [bacterium]
MLLLLVSASLAASAEPEPQAANLPAKKFPWGHIVQHKQLLELHVTALPDNREIRIPRLNNRMKSLTLLGQPKTELNFTPLLTEWKITLPKPVAAEPVPVILLETLEPVHVPVNPFVVSQSKSGDVDLPAHHVITHGELLRYEPQPHKNTLGYWANAKDWAEWQFAVDTPGKFDVEVHQGCGKGQGGSDVQIDVAGQKLDFVVEDTGHFQNFKPRRIGRITILQSGNQTLQIHAVKKAKNAVCDIRLIRLIRIAD